MKGVFFGAEQLAPGVVGLDYDDEYFRRAGTLVPLDCVQPRIPIEGTDGTRGAERAAALAAVEGARCPQCGRVLEVVQGRTIFGAAWSAKDLECPTARALRVARERGESGPVYRWRPFEIVETVSSCDG